MRITFRDGCVVFFCGYPFPRDDEPSCAWGLKGACACERATGADGSTFGVWPHRDRPCPVPVHLPDIVSLVDVDRDGIPFDRSAWTQGDAIGHLIRSSRPSR